MFAIVMGDPQTAQTASASTLRFAAVSLPEAVVALVAYFRVKRCGSISAAVSSSFARRPAARSGDPAFCGHATRRRRGVFH
jgi:hypothetical protein